MGEYTVEYPSHGTENNIIITLAKWSTPLKAVYLHFLLSLNEEFDDDLLFDSYELLIE